MRELCVGETVYHLENEYHTDYDPVITPRLVVYTHYPSGTIALAIDVAHGAPTVVSHHCISDVYVSRPEAELALAMRLSTTAREFRGL